MATYFPPPIGSPNRAIDHFSTGLAAAVRTTGTTYTSGSTARIVVIQATPAAAPSRAGIEVADSGATFRRVAEGDFSTIASHSFWAIVPPNTNYRFVNITSTWTVDAAYEANL